MTAGPSAINSEASVMEFLLTLPEESFLRRYVLWAKPQTDAPLIFHVFTAMSLLAGVAPKFLHSHTMNKVYPTFWTMLVGDSAETRKSSVIRIGNRLLAAVDPVLVGGHPGSPEGFAKLMKRSATLVISYDEFGEFLSRTAEGRYQEQIRLTYTAAWDADTVTHELAKRAVIVTDPRLSLLVGTTPAFLEDYSSPRDWTGGFFNRFAIVFAKRERRYAVPAEPDEEMTMWLVDRLTGCIKLASSGPPKAGGWSKDASEYWEAWMDGITGRYEDTNQQRYARNAAARTPTVAAKAALLLAMDFGCVGSAGWKTPLEVCKAATWIAERHLDSVLHVLDGLCTSNYAQRRKSVLDVLPLGKALTTGAIMRIVMPPMDKRLTVDTLMSLVEEGRVVRYEGVGGSGIESWALASEDDEAGGQTDGGENGDGNVLAFL